jgi:gliding motility-associated-like protein
MCTNLTRNFKLKLTLFCCLFTLFLTADAFGIKPGSDSNLAGHRKNTLNTIAVSPGNALSFAGYNYTDHGTAINQALAGTSQLTLETWVYITNYDGLRSPLGNYGADFSGIQMQYMLRLENGHPAFWLDAGSGFQPLGSPTKLPLNTWVHWAATWNGTTMAMYINGALVAKRDDVTGSFHMIDQPLKIGRSATFESFVGKIDEVKIWNTVKSQAEIQAGMFTPTNPASEGLLAYFNFNAGSTGGDNPGITTLTDLTGHGYDGTLQYFQLNGTESNWVKSYAMVVPVALEATDITTSGFTANWALPFDGNGYLLAVSTNINFVGGIAGSPFMVSGTSKAITGLKAGGRYYYRVYKNTPVADPETYSGRITVNILAAPPAPLVAPGNALSFAGYNYTDHGTAINQALAGTSQLTLETWVNISTHEGLRSPLGNYGADFSGIQMQYMLRIENGYPAFWLDAGSGFQPVGSPTMLPLNTWVHLAATWNGTTMALYVNGALVAKRDNVTGSFHMIDQPLKIGRSATFESIIGKVDEVKIWNSVRSQAQIQAGMLTPTNPASAGLLAYFDFDAGKAAGTNTGVNTLKDLTGHGYDGSLQYFQLNGTASNWVESYAMVVPVALEATKLTASGFTANWQKPQTGLVDNGYRLDVSVSPTFETVITGSPFSTTGTSKALTGLDMSKKYYYRVRADKKSVTGQGGSSAVILVRKAFELPVISYAGPKNYIKNVAITPLMPTASGVSAPAYRAELSTVGSGFDKPYATAVDMAGNVYVADVITGTVYAMAAGTQSSVTIASGMDRPSGVAVDANGVVYVAEAGKGAIKMIPAGGGTPVTLNSSFKNPLGIAVDGKGFVYVSDYSFGTVSKINILGGSLAVIGSGFNHPTGIAVDAMGNVYVADSQNSAVKRIPAAGGSPVLVSNSFYYPTGVALDNAGNIYVVDNGINALMKIPAGKTSPTKLNTALNQPFGLCIDGAGQIYVADAGSHSVKQASPAGGYFISPALPKGLLFNTITGAISGTPTALSPATDYIVTGYNANESARATITISVSSTPPTLALAPKVMIEAPATSLQNQLPAITASSALSPNGDGLNDTWLIKNIEQYPNSNVSVYDKSGVLVFSKKGYQNDWGGTANGKPLNEGTLFYVISLSEKETVKGFIVMKNK